MRLAPLALLLALALGACETPLGAPDLPPIRPSIGMLDIRPETGAVVAWRVTDANVYQPGSGQASVLALGGSEDAVPSHSPFTWSVWVPFTGALTPGRVVELGSLALAGGSTWGARFSSGVVLASGCGTPSWSATGESGRLVIESVTAEAITGTVEATFVAPYANRVFGPRVTVRSAFRAAR